MIGQHICLPEKLREYEAMIIICHRKILNPNLLSKGETIPKVKEWLKMSIRLSLQITEMLSWANYQFTQEQLNGRTPTCADLEQHYMGKELELVPTGEKAISDENSGSYKFRMKWEELWKAVLSCEEIVKKHIRRESTYADLYFYFKKNDGLIHFWADHPEDLFIKNKTVV